MNNDNEAYRLVPPAPAWRAAAEALPLLALIAVALWLWLSQPAPAPSPQPVEPVPLQPVHAGSAGALEAIFQQHDYRWLPEGPVPPLALRSFPPDLAETRVPLKKSLFFRSLLPLVLAENRAIRRERAMLESLFRTATLEADSPGWRQARAIARRYRVEGDLNDPEVRRRLLIRVDTVPPSLALAQAANESAWGTSRFAREGNNLFGQWTWDASQGMMPRRRASDADHYVRRFDSLRDSVRGYLLNLNTHSAYAELRRQRAALRRQGIRVTGMRLAGGLTAYSERGLAYVNEIRAMIAFNRLQRINDARLAMPGQDSASR